MKSKLETKVVVHWRPTGGEPSPLWRKLWARLLTHTKTTPASTRGAGGDRGWKDGDEGNLPNE